MLKGAITALVTPFKNGRIDEEAYRALIERQIRGRDPWTRALRHHRRIPHPVP